VLVFFIFFKSFPFNQPLNKKIFLPKDILPIALSNVTAVLSSKILSLTIISGTISKAYSKVIENHILLYLNFLALRKNLRSPINHRSQSEALVVKIK
jgi:hypothetical protein